MIRLTYEEWTEQIKAQGVPREHAAVVCPMCQTAQSATSFKLAGAEPGALEKQLGFSCVGRWTGAGSSRKKPDGNPCNWSLGGFLQLHECEVTKDGDVVKTFRPATPEEAKALMERNGTDARKSTDRPIDMTLNCPECGVQHIDKADPDNCEDCGHSDSAHFNAGERNICAGDSEVQVDIRIGADIENDCNCEDFNPWLNPPHKTHRCQSCNHVWRPFEYPTNGVAVVGYPESEVKND